MLRYEPRLLVLAFAITMVGAVLAAIPFNLLVDPYWRFELVDVPGWNQRKPAFQDNPWLGKAHRVCAIQPVNLIIGSSRSEGGLDPHDAAFGRFPGITYNLGTAAASMEELEQIFRHAVYASPGLRLVVMGLDFFAFNASREAAGTSLAGFDRRRLLDSPRDSCRRAFWHDWDWFLGRRALVASVETVLDQRTPTLYEDTGLLRLDVMGASFLEKNGQREAFRRIERYFAKDLWRAGPAGSFCFTAAGHDSFRSLRRILDLARERDIDLRLFVSPVHARLLIALEAVGLWPRYEEWKREVVSQIAAEGARHEAPARPLWDFSGFNTVTTEPVPPDSDLTGRMRGYWETSHFTTSVGALVLERILGAPEADRDVPNDFGAALDPSTVDAVLERIREMRERYRERAPGETSEVRAVVAEVAPAPVSTTCVPTAGPEIAADRFVPFDPPPTVD